MVRRLCLIGGLIVGLLGSGLGLATPVLPRESMQTTLVRLIAQLDAMQPLIDQAAAEQNPKARVTFHFDSWVDDTGQTHPGFRQSVLRMRQALVAQLQQPNLTPTTVTPLADDFVGR